MTEITDRYNLDFLIRIRVIDEKKLHHVIYKEYSPGTLWNFYTETKAGYYNISVLEEKYLGEDLDRYIDLFVKEDGSVWKKPRLKLYFVNDIVVTNYHKTLQSAKLKAKDLERLSKAEFMYLQ